MDLTGKQISEYRENDMSITSNNCTTHKIYKIILDEGESVVAELKNTNKYMYSGDGSFTRFKKEDIEFDTYLHKRTLSK